MKLQLFLQAWEWSYSMFLQVWEWGCSCSFRPGNEAAAVPSGLGMRLQLFLQAWEWSYSCSFRSGNEATAVPSGLRVQAVVVHSGLGMRLQHFPSDHNDDSLACSNNTTSEMLDVEQQAWVQLGRTWSYISSSQDVTMAKGFEQG